MIPILLLLCFQEPELVIPSVGRPDRDFYNGAGQKVVVTQKLEPSKLKVGEWATYTLDIRGLLKAKEVERPKLDSLPFFKSHFQIEEMPDPKEQAKDQRTFIYRLRPRDALPKEIPPFAFRYYDPRVQDAEAAFRLTAAGAISMEIESTFPNGNNIDSSKRPMEFDRHGTSSFLDPVHDPVGLFDYCRALSIPMLGFAWLLACRSFLNPSPVERKRGDASRELMNRWKSLPDEPASLKAEAMFKAVAEYLNQALRFQPGVATLDGIRSDLNRDHSDIAGPVCGFLETCESRRYGGEVALPSYEDLESLMDAVKKRGETLR